MQSPLRAAARRLAKGPSLPCASAISGPMPLSGVLPSMCVPEAPHAGPLLRLLGGRFISTSASFSSDPNLKPQAQGGGAPAPGATTNTATGGETPPHLPPFRLVSFGGPSDSKLRDSGEYIQQKDVLRLRAVPADRLITRDACRPYLFPDLGRSLFRSALLIPFISHIRKLSCEGLFKKQGNIGVIEELNAFGLKEFFPYEVEVLTEATRQKNYQEARDFAIEQIEKVYGKDVMMLFPAFKRLCKVIDKLPLNEDKIVNNVVLLSREDTATLVKRMHDFLIKVVPLQQPWLKAKAVSIFNGMPYTGSDEPYIPTAMNDEWFIHWLDKYDYDTLNNSSKGKGLLKFHRHGCSAHWLETYVNNIVPTLKSEEQKQSLTADPFTREDVLDHYDYNFPKLPSQTFDLFEIEQLDGHLNIHDLFHSPTRYH